MGAALEDPERWDPEAFEPAGRGRLADAAVREQGRVVAAGLAFSVRTFLSPIWAQAVEDGVAEGLLPDAVSLVLGDLEPERASPLREARQGGGISLQDSDFGGRCSSPGTIAERAAEGNPGPIRRKDLDRVQRYIRKTWRGASIDLQSKTLEEPFLTAAGDAMRTAAREKWGKDRFLAEIDRLADEHGAAGFRGSYAKTWHQTAVVNQSWNNGVLLMYGAEPTRRLYPYLILYTMEDDRVRPNHEALSRVVARSTWEGWQRYAPPLGWNCRCRLAPVSYIVAQASGWIDADGIGEDFPNGEPREGAGRDAGFSLPLITLPLRRAA